MAARCPMVSLYELPLRYKTTRQPEEKRRIAREAARRVRDGSAIGLTGGTTTTEVARALVDRAQLTVVTNALNIASEIAVRPNLKLVVTGGVARAESYELVGPLAEASLEGLNLDMAFLVGRRHLAPGRAHHPARDRGRHRPRADRRAPSGWWSSPTAPSSAGSPSPGSASSTDVDELITDGGADVAAVTAIQDAGVQVTIV